ncbi:MAG: helix-turn-helix transcriptional regulator [Gammaproteobacteria bacterium]|jgi:transcriptional regulator with XRE-family HTH domain
MTLRETAKPVNAKFGQLLRFWREAWELTQEDLAGLVGSSPRHISRMENALVRASDQMVEKLALALNLRERDRDWFIYTATKSVDRDPLEVVSAQPDWLTETFEILTSAFGNNPAVVTDVAGRIQMTNPAWEAMIAPECNHVDTTPSINSFYEGMFDASESHPPAGWGRTRIGLLLSFRQSSIIRPENDMQSLFESLFSKYDFPTDWARRAAGFDPRLRFPITYPVNGRPTMFDTLSFGIDEAGLASIRENAWKLYLLVPHPSDYLQSP